MKARAVSAVSLEEKRATEALVLSHLASPTTWTAFTDGSALRNPGPAGAAAILLLPAKSFEDDKKDHVDVKDHGGDVKVERGVYVSERAATNNQMELKGLELALDLLEEKHKKEARPLWMVFSDSEYMRGLFEKGHTAHKNSEIVSILRSRISNLKESLGVTVRVAWVRSHCGIRWNEEADRLARDAAKQSQKKIGPGTGFSSANGSSANKSTGPSIALNRTKPKPAKRKLPLPAVSNPFTKKK